MSDFSDYLASLTGGAGTTFSPGSAAPYVSGITQNVLTGTVNTGTHTGSVDTELLSHPGGTSGHSLAGTMTTPTSVTVQQAAMALYGLRPDEIRALQDRLVAAGYVTAKDISTRGVVDGATAKAYGDLLQDTSAYNAAGNPLTVSDLLSQRSGARAAAGTGSGTIAPNFETTVHTYSPTDPARLRLTAEAAFQDALGRKPKKAELARFVERFTSEEMSAQGQVFSAQDQARGEYIGREQAAAGVPVTATGGSERDARVAAMIAAAPGEITVTSGTRSTERQQQLWDAAVKKYGSAEAARKWVAPPGHSQHEKGNADDLHFADAKTRAWAHANAARFGLVFPLANESWHVEVAGARGGVQAASAVAPTPIGSPPVSTSVVVSQPDAGAQAVEFARAQNPNETQAYDIGTQFSNLLSILGKPVV